jgi:WD40 repeat protein
MMLPSKRLTRLLEQAQEYQKSACQYHCKNSLVTSLYHDHNCGPSVFPRNTSHIFEEHADEVWFLSFSNDGTMLASASRDSHAIIWDVVNFTVKHVLDSHKKAISFLSWSKDDKLILTASNDFTIKLWDTATGQMKFTYNRHTESVTSCAWLPSGDKFVSGSLEKNVYLWSIEGVVLYKWAGIRIMDLAITNDGKTLIAASEKKIRFFNLDDFSEQGSILETESITSVHVAKDGIHLLVNLSIQVFCSHEGNPSLEFRNASFGQKI